MFLGSLYEIHVEFDGYKVSFYIFILLQLSFLETSNVTCTLPEGRMPWNMSRGSPVLGRTRACTTSTLQDKLLRTPQKGVENGWRTETRYTDKSREMLDYNLQALFRWENLQGNGNSSSEWPRNRPTALRPLLIVSSYTSILVFLSAT